MTFCSVGFIFFLAVTVLLYYVLPKRYQPKLLLFCSLVFCLRAGVACLIFVLFSSSVSFFGALLLDRNIENEREYLNGEGALYTREERCRIREQRRKKRLKILALELIVLFVPLIMLKFFTSGLFQVWSVVDRMNRSSYVLPLGVSYYTLQCAGYLIDIYRGKYRSERKFWHFALFVGYFPQLILGPISRYQTLATGLTESHAAKWENIIGGINRIAWGYFKKLVIADTAIVAVKALTDTQNPYGGVYVLILIVLYSVEIYADFTGGIDIVIGISEMLGIKMPENFDRPFSSMSAREYWNRWHITLGAWFTDYVFYPLSICKPIQKMSKKIRERFGRAIGKRLPLYIATVSTWLLTGFWHGASPNFIFWGFANSLVILISQELAPIFNRLHAFFPRLKERRVWQIFCKTRTFFVIGAIRLLDVYGSVAVTVSAWGSIFRPFDSLKELITGGIDAFGLDKYGIGVLLVGTLAMILVSKISAGSEGDLGRYIADRPLIATLCPVLLIIVTLVFGSYGIGFERSSFIYTQF